MEDQDNIDDQAITLAKHFFHNGYEYRVEYVTENNILVATIAEIPEVKYAPNLYRFYIAKSGLTHDLMPHQRLYQYDESIVAPLTSFLVEEINLEAILQELTIKIDT